MAARTKRRGNGEGSIYQRIDDGRWCAVITVGRNATGKRIRRTISGSTKREILEELTRLKTRKQDGTLTDSARMTVAEFLARWLTDCARQQISDGTYANYDRMIRLHIAPVIGGGQLAKLTPVDVQSLYATIKSPFVCDTAHTVLHQAFAQAVKWNLMVRNVCDAVDAPRLPVKEVTPLQPEQVSVFVEAIRGDRLEALYVTAIGTGMRLGELFALRWEDINFQERCLSVRRSLQEIGGKLSLKEPKSKKGRRRIDLPQSVVDALNEHRKQLFREGLAGCPWVFPNTRGGNLRRSHFHKQSYKPLLLRAGLPPFKFHDLRHTAATLMLMQGTHPKVVQERMGHSQISVTLDTYSHVLPTMQREAADRFDVFLAPKAAAGA